jgi:putative MATE family efflux protein
VELLMPRLYAYFPLLHAIDFVHSERIDMTKDLSRAPLASIALPFFIENIVRTSLMAVDQFMLYAYSEKAAASMSTVNQFAFFIQLLYMMVAIGASILIAQNLGAGRREDAGVTALAGLVMIAAFAVIISLAVSLSAPLVLRLFTLEDEVRGNAVAFLTIYGACSIFMALNLVQSAILRAYGYPRDPMIVNIVALALTIVGNALVLFGPFDLPVKGVAGVACSTVFSQFAAFCLMQRILRARKSKIDLHFRRVFSLPRSAFRAILAIGVPTAGENIAYNLSQIVIVSFIARMGTATLAAYGLVVTLSRYVFISGVSIGSASQLKVGYLVGAGRHDAAYRKVYRYFLTGISISAAAVIVLNVAKRPVIALFTLDPTISVIAASALAAALVLEPGRSFNTIIIPSLKGAGDVRFPVFVGMCVMWCVGVPTAWLLGVKLELGLVGIWLGMSVDEWTRGLIMLFRWKSGAWRTKRLVR